MCLLFTNRVQKSPKRGTFWGKVLKVFATLSFHFGSTLSSEYTFYFLIFRMGYRHCQSQLCCMSVEQLCSPAACKKTTEVHVYLLVTALDYTLTVVVLYMLDWIF